MVANHGQQAVEIIPSLPVTHTHTHWYHNHIVTNKEALATGDNKILSALKGLTDSFSIKQFLCLFLFVSAI